MNQYYGAYQPNMNMNMLPQQQILQANGKASIDMLRMAPNSSVLIADTTAPIVWKCVSDGLGNVTAEPFDILPHKDEAQIERESMAVSLEHINTRLTNLEAIINESNFTRNAGADAEFVTAKTGNAGNQKRKKPTGNAYTDDAE